MKKFIKSFLATFLFVIAIFLLLSIIHKKTTKIKELKKVIDDQHQNIIYKNDVILQSYNSVKRMQLIAGVDTIDNVFTYQEKLANPVNTRKLTRANLRDKK